MLIQAISRAHDVRTREISKIALDVNSFYLKSIIYERFFNAACKRVGQDGVRRNQGVVELLPELVDPVEVVDELPLESDVDPVSELEPDEEPTVVALPEVIVLASCAGL